MSDKTIFVFKVAAASLTATGTILAAIVELKSPPSKIFEAFKMVMGKK